MRSVPNTSLSMKSLPPSHYLLLQVTAAEYNYERIASLLTKINGTVTILERYVLVKKIDEVKRLYAITRATLRRKIFTTFREIGQVSSLSLSAKRQERFFLPPQCLISPLQIMDGVSNEGPLVPHYSDSIISSLKNAHLVIEALGQDTVDDLMTEIVQSQLLPYDQMGREGGPLFKLEKDSFERR